MSSSKCTVREKGVSGNEQYIMVANDNGEARKIAVSNAVYEEIKVGDNINVGSNIIKITETDKSTQLDAIGGVGGFDSLQVADMEEDEAGRTRVGLMTFAFGFVMMAVAVIVRLITL